MGSAILGALLQHMHFTSWLQEVVPVALLKFVIVLFAVGEELSHELIQVQLDKTWLSIRCSLPLLDSWEVLRCYGLEVLYFVASITRHVDLAPECYVDTSEVDLALRVVDLEEGSGYLVHFEVVLLELPLDLAHPLRYTTERLHLSR